MPEVVSKAVGKNLKRPKEIQTQFTEGQVICQVVSQLRSFRSTKYNIQVHSSVPIYRTSKTYRDFDALRLRLRAKHAQVPALPEKTNGIAENRNKLERTCSISKHLEEWLNTLLSRQDVSGDMDMCKFLGLHQTVTLAAWDGEILPREKPWYVEVLQQAGKLTSPKRTGSSASKGTAGSEGKLTSRRGSCEIASQAPTRCSSNEGPTPADWQAPKSARLTATKSLPSQIGAKPPSAATPARSQSFGLASSSTHLAGQDDKVESGRRHHKKRSAAQDTAEATCPLAYSIVPSGSGAVKVVVHDGASEGKKKKKKSKRK